MKLLSLIAISFALLSASPAYATKSIFDGIADDADFGNGTWEIKKYDKKLDKKDLEELATKQLKKARWDNCGPWNEKDSEHPGRVNPKDRSDGIEIIDEINAKNADNMKTKKSKMGAKLKALYKDDQIRAIVRDVSSQEIVECCLNWFNIYGEDGTVLELRYNLGD